MRRYINKKSITIFLIVIVTIILSGNFFTCPRYLNQIGLDSFNASLSWFEDTKFNSTVIHYNGFWGEADFGFIVYLLTPILRPITPQDINTIAIVVEKISEKTYNPLVKGFIINIERVDIFIYRNETEIHWSTALDFKRYLPNSSEFFYSIYQVHRYLPEKLYARVDYSVHVIINPYFEIWYSEFKYITIGFHVKVYSGSLIIPIIIKPE
ncbi:MAG: hypothetical protein NDF57_04835 [archaeon GBS-70-058]|nr:hypothetical protein [Candidatus Culexarchaeum nevadense]